MQPLAEQKIQQLNRCPPKGEIKGKEEEKGEIKEKEKSCSVAAHQREK